MHLVLLALGMLLGIYGALLSESGPRAAGHVFTWGIGISIVGNVGAGILGRVGAGRPGGITPLVGWLVVAYALSISRPNGSVILAGGDLLAPTLVFLIAGSLCGAAAAVLAPPRRWRRSVS